MGSIVLDASKVNSYVLPNLKKSKNTMQDAYSTGQSLRNSLPSSFTYRSTVNDIVNQIYNIRREISDIDTIVSKKIERAKTIESKHENRVSGIAKAASSVGSIVGTIGGSAIGVATGGVAVAVAGAVVGNKVGSAVGKGLVNTGAKIVKGAVKVGKTILNGIKSIGNWIWNGCKKVVNAIASFVKDAVSGLVKAAKAVWEGLKWVGKQILRVGATIINAVVSLVEGLVSFIEAIGDVVLLVVGAVCTVFTFLADLVTGIATGEWEWKATSAVWKKWIMPWVGYDWTSKAFEWQGKWFINDWAYKPFKRGETGANIIKGVGYYTGMIVATYFTAGAATAVSGVSAVGSVSVSTISQGAVAATASLGKNTQKNYNKTIDAKVKDHYVSELMKTNRNITLEDATAIVEQNIENGVYSDISDVRKSAMDNISGGEIAGNIGKAAGTAVIDGGIYFAAGAAGDYVKVAKEAGNAGKVAQFAINHKDGVTTTIKASKAYISEGYNSLVDGDEFDWKGATIDAASVVIAENALRGIKSNDVLKKGLYKYETPKVTNQVTDGMAGFNKGITEQGVKTLKENLGKIATESVAKGTEKGQEKFIKDTVGGLYDVAVDNIGLT